MHYGTTSSTRSRRLFLIILILDNLAGMVLVLRLQECKGISVQTGGSNTIIVILVV